MAEHDARDPSLLPEVRDEAADTPPWVPILGVALLTAMVLLYVLRLGVAEDADPAAAVPAPENEAVAAE